MHNTLGINVHLLHHTAKLCSPLCLLCKSHHSLSDMCNHWSRSVVHVSSCIVHMWYQGGYG